MEQLFYTLSAQQTEAGLSAPDPALAGDEKTVSLKGRIDGSLGHLAYGLAFFPARIRYSVADGFYSK